MQLFCNQQSPYLCSNNITIGIDLNNFIIFII